MIPRWHRPHPAAGMASAAVFTNLLWLVPGAWLGPALGGAMVILAAAALATGRFTAPDRPSFAPEAAAVVYSLLTALAGMLLSGPAGLPELTNAAIEAGRLPLALAAWRIAVPRFGLEDALAAASALPFLSAGHQRMLALACWLPFGAAACLRDAWAAEQRARHAARIGGMVVRGTSLRGLADSASAALTAWTRALGHRLPLSID